jgi:penicillin-binding protein 1A
MKLCYADPQLKVSKEEFERPENLSIKVDCYSAPKAKDTTAVQNTDEFEF